MHQVSPSSPRSGPQRSRNDPSSVAGFFDAHARSYDRLVAAKPGYHEHLRMSTKRMGLRGGGTGLRLLDLGCGTGASTAALLDAAPEAEITAVDASPEMLEVARGKTWPSRVRFVHGNVDDLDQKVITGDYDGILAASLLRTMPDRNAALRTFRSLLRPGAPLALHEYSVADSARSRMRWTAACWGLLIPLSRMRAGSSDLHRYLWRSTVDFDGVEALTTRMRATGFEDVRVQTVPGWQQHIVHTFLGRCPGRQVTEPVAGSEAPTPPVGVPAAENSTPTPPGGLDMTKSS